MQVRGEVHSQGSWFRVQHRSGLLQLFSSSRSLVLSHGLMLPPSRCCGWWYGHVQLSRSSHPPSSLLACVHLFWSSMFSLSLWCIPYGSPCREPGRPLPSSSLQASSASLSPVLRPVLRYVASSIRQSTLLLSWIDIKFPSLKTSYPHSCGKRSFPRSILVKPINSF